MISALRWLLPYWRPYKWRMAGILLAGLASAALGAFYPYLIKQVINGLTAQLTPHYLLRAILLVLSVGVSNALISILSQRSRVYMNLRLEWDLRRKLFAHVLRMDRNFFHAYTTGDLVTRLQDDVSRKISWFACSGIFRFVQSVFALVAVVFMMFLINVPLAVYMLIPVPFMLAAVLMTNRRLRAQYDALQLTIAQIYNFLGDCLSTVKLIKANVKERTQYRFFSEKTERQMQAEVSAARLDILMSYFSNSATYISVSILFLAGGKMVMDGKATLGDLIAFHLYSGMIMRPLLDISQFFVAGNRAAASIGRVTQIMEGRNSLLAPISPLPVPRRVETIEARDVSVTSSTGEHLLKKVSFTARRGQLVAIVGEIGSGKSTLISALARLIELSSGELLINGVNVRDFDPAELRSHFGYIAQDPFIFTDTIKNNITLEREMADDQSLPAALRISQLKHTIDRMPHKGFTPVGTRGHKISGGQKQRIAIARGILERPGILIFDDATSAMDARTEDAFWREYHAEMPDAISIVATHRVKTIERADLILTLRGGQLVEKGTHAELLALNGVYHEMFRNHIMPRNENHQTGS